MTTVKIANGKAWVGNTPVSLLNGAVHYWRLNPASWGIILDAVRDMGLETIDTYINWQFHELQPGQCDFTGETDERRNLQAFLELTKQMGLWLVVRPGPFIYSESVNMGVPTDVARYHRMHPYFVERASGYIQEVCRVLKPFLATNGGQIILLQSDNETDPFVQCYEEQLGLGSEPGLFHEFLQGKYGDIQQLNARWGSNYETFEQARPVMDLIEVDPHYRLRNEDFIEFRADYITRCVAHYARLYRDNGIDVPISHNTYNIYHVQDFASLAKAVDLVGPDAYPANEFPTRTSASGEELGMRHLQEVFRYYRSISETAYIPEYQCGTGHGLHYYTGVLWPNHFVMQNLAAVQAGIQAWNWYMLVNRDNWMMSPINEWGRKQGEMFDVFAEMVKIHKEEDIPSWKKLTSTAITFPLRYHWQKEALSDPVLNAVYQAGIEYEFFNLENRHIPKPLVLYSGPRWLPEDQQQALLDYVQQGGHLVFFTSLPLYRDPFEPHNRLELHRPDGIPDEPFLDHLASETEVNLGGCRFLTRAPFFVYGHPTPGEAIWAERVDTRSIMDTHFEENRYLRSLVFGHRYQVGYRESRGRGSITVLGVRASPQAVKCLHTWLGIPVPVLPGLAEVKASLFEREGTYYLVAINTGDGDVVAPFDLHLPGGNAALVAADLRGDPDFDLDTSGLEAGRLYLRMPRKNGTILKLSHRQGRRSSRQP